MKVGKKTLAPGQGMRWSAMHSVHAHKIRSQPGAGQLRADLA